jgi:hypothetical protein
MRATDPVVLLVLVLAIGIVAGLLFDRLAGPSWLARQFSGSTIRRLSHRHACAWRGLDHFARRRGGGFRRGAVRLADGQVTEGYLPYACLR